MVKAQHKFPYRDQFANRLLILGILLMLVPCLLTILAMLFYGWPLLAAMLPRGVQPVIGAQEGETLVLLAAFEGASGHDPTEDIDDALLEVARTRYLPGMRIARLSSRPTTAQAARQLGERYRANLLIWGTYDPNNFTVHYEILDPIDMFEPTRYSFTLPQNQTMALNYLETFNEALILVHNPDLAASYFEPAYVLDRLADPSGTGLDPAVVAVYRADLARLQGNHHQALDFLQDALLNGHSSAELYALMGLSLLNEGDTEGARQAVAETLNLNPGLAGAYYVRGLIYQTEGLLDRAVADLSHALSIIPQDETALFRRATIYAQLGAYQEAIDDYSTLIALQGPSTYGYGYSGYEPDYYLERGLLYWEIGDERAARDDWDVSLRQRYGGSAAGYNNLAWEMALRGYYEPALQYSEISLEMAPLDPPSLHTRGYIRLGLGEWQAAIEDFQAALANGISYDPIYRDLGDAYFGLGDYRQAITAYELYLQLEPFADDVATVEQKLWEARAALQR